VPATLFKRYAPKAPPAYQNLRHLWPAICLAQKVGKGLARSKILQRAMPKA